MRKEDVSSIIVYLLMIVLAVIVGLTAISNAFGELYSSFNASFNSFAFAIIAILTGLLFNVIMLEVCHIIGAKIGKYNVISFNILGLCWYKNENGWKFGLKDFDGLTGETRLSPKSKDSNLKAFVWIPLVAYLIELVVGIVIYSSAGAIHGTNPKSPLCWMGVAALLWIVISSMIALYNFVPIKLDSMTDGYRLVLISNKVNREALNELMRIENLQRNNRKIDQIKIFDEITEFTVSLNLYSIYEDLAKEEYKKAEELIDKILEHVDKISVTSKMRLLAQKLYIKIVTLPKEESKDYYEKEIKDDMRRFISNDLSMESIRAYVLIAGLLDDSFGEVEYAHSRKSKAIKRSLSGRISIENKLYKDALKKVQEAHPDWDLSKALAE